MYYHKIRSINTLDKALFFNAGVDWGPHEKVTRIQMLLKYDKKHLHCLPYNSKQQKKLSILDKVKGTAAERTANVILLEYLRQFCKSYHVPENAYTYPAARRYISDLKIDILPNLSDHDKLGLKIMNDNKYY